MAKSNFLKKYLHSEDYIHVYGNPLNEYLIDLNGNVVDLNGNKVSPYFDDEGDLTVQIKVRTFGNILSPYKVSHLVQHTFKPTKLPFEYYCDIAVLYRDDNRLNLHPSNLVWHWTALEHWRYPGFAIIPGASNYCISKESEIINISKNFKVEQHVSGGYLCASIVPDVGGKFKARVHRLKCLAWSNYPSVVDDLDVNHIDGIKTNLTLTNLEWSTPTENALHASSSGLCKYYKVKILMRELYIDRVDGSFKTMEILFKSMTDCANYNLIDPTTVVNRLNKDLNLTYISSLGDKSTLDIQHCIQFKVDDGSPWLDPLEDDNPYLNSQVPEPVKVRNILTGDISMMNNAKEAAKSLNIGYRVITHLITYRRLWPAWHYDVKYITDMKPWLHFNVDQLAIYDMMRNMRRYHRKGDGYKLVHSCTREVLYFINEEHCRSFFNITSSTFQEHKQKKNLIRKWIVTAINLKGGLVDED